MINIGELTRKQALLRAGELAVYDQPNDIRMTFQQLNQLVNRQANALLALGVGKGDRVSAYSRNSIDFFALFFACGKIGAIVHAINWRLGDREIEFVLNDGKPRVLLYQSEFAETVESLKGSVPSVEHWLDVDPRPDTDYQHLLAKASDGEPRVDYPVGDNDPLLILYTGGTTGQSKGVLHSHQTVYFGMLNQTVAEGIQPDSVYMLTGQMFHIPIVLAINYTAHGCPVVLMNFDAELALRLIEQERVTGFLGITTMLNWMLAHPKFDQFDLTSLRCVQYGGGPMPSRVIEEVAARLPGRIIQGYGQTEGSTMSFLSYEDHLQAIRGEVDMSRLTSCGREGFVTQIRVVDEEGNDVPNDGSTPGEIIVRSPANMLGYYLRPDLTEKTLIDGWLHTGDVATWDEHRYLYIKDRAKDMIISGGENIYSVQVEDAICKHPSVLEVAVIGVPCEEWGERVKAFVVLKPETTATAEEIIETAKANLASYQKPRMVEFVDSLPKAPTGKILKRLLREP